MDKYVDYKISQSTEETIDFKLIGYTPRPNIRCLQSSAFS